MPNEITTRKKTVSMMSAQKAYIESISAGLKYLIGSATTYQSLCGYNILNQINVALAKEGLNHQSPNVDKESINNAIKYAMFYELNTDNAEVFVNTRNEKRKAADSTDYYVKKIEVKPQYRGHLKIISKFGRDVEHIYPEWIVREGDEFTYQTYKGIDVIPPTWTPKSQDGKVLRVVVPIKRKNGFIDYRVAERESVATNIKAQIKQALITKKEEQARVCALVKDMTLDQLLTDKSVCSYVNDTYTGISQEEMIITKLVINATKRVAIDFANAFVREITEKTYDNADVYEKNHNAKAIIENEQTLIEMQDSVEEIELKGNVEKVEEIAPTPKQEETQSLQDFFDEEFGN